MKQKWVLIACVLVLVSIITYKQLATYPLKQDLKGGTILSMRDMNRMAIPSFRR